MLPLRRFTQSSTLVVMFSPMVSQGRSMVKWGGKWNWRLAQIKVSKANQPLLLCTSLPLGSTFFLCYLHAPCVPKFKYRYEDAVRRDYVAGDSNPAQRAARLAAWFMHCLRPLFTLIFLPMFNILYCISLSLSGLLVYNCSFLLTKGFHPSSYLIGHVKKSRWILLHAVVREGGGGGGT